MGSATEPYNDAFNPFSDDRMDDDVPDFSNARVVMAEPSCEFDMTEFPICFDEGLSFRGMTQVAEATNQSQETTLDVHLPASSSPSHSIDRGRVNELTPVLTQPRRGDDVRRQIPVYTLGWTSTSDPQLMAATGLDFLIGVHEVLLQQTVTSLDSPNQSAKRYIIKIPNGETLYHTSENARELERICCGSQRSFRMSLLDHTHQEAAQLHRTLGCVFGWLPCLLQELRVFTPGGVYVGKVKQDLSWSGASFTVLDSHGDDLFRLFGPNDCAAALPLDASFTIAGGTGGGRLGVISRRWSGSLGDYNLHVAFPASGTPLNQKLLLIAASMLIEYMFFEHRRTSCLRLC